MKKLKELRAWLVLKQAELAQLSRAAQQTGNPHLSTQYRGGALELIQVIAEIDRLLVKKGKKLSTP